MKFNPIEGNTQKLDGGAMFGNAPRPMWEKWSPPDELNRIELACRALLVQTDDGRNLLFEAGIGTFFEPKLRERFGVQESQHVLVESLKKVGLKPEDIHAVILSHLHFDHAGGILSAYEDGPQRLLFTNAKYYVGERHWHRALEPHSRDKASFVPHMNELLKNSGKLVLVPDSGKSDLAPLVTFRFSDGHTIGLMLAQINHPEGPVVFATDLIPGAAWVHVPISMGYDRFPELVIDEKRKLLEDILPQKGKLFFTHDPKVSLGKLCKQPDSGKFYVESISPSSL